MSRVFVNSMQGFGDNIYQLPHIRDLAKRCEEVYIDTTFPQLYEDIQNVKFVFRETELRFQKSNLGTFEKSFFIKKHDCQKYIRMSYALHKLRTSTVSGCFDEITMKPETFDYKLNRKYKIDLDFQDKPKNKKLCLLKLPTIRDEWKCPARVPLMKYFQALIDEYKDEYYFLSLACIDETERFSEELPKGIDELDHSGSDYYRLLAQVEKSDMIISCPSFMLPLSLSLEKKNFCIFGGHIAPEHLIDNRYNTDYVYACTPEPFCNCFDKYHNCNKEIDIERMKNEFRVFMERRVG